MAFISYPERCIRIREIANNLWLSNPGLTKKELQSAPEMQCEIGQSDNEYQERLLSELASFYTDRAVVERYFIYDGWTAEECIAIWLNLEPITLKQIMQDKSGSGHVRPYGAELIAKARDYIEQVQRSAFVEMIAYKRKGVEMHFRPEVFFKWATNKWGVPFGYRQRQFCKEILEQTRLPEVPSPPNKVELKKQEIVSILDRLSAEDPHFDRMAMHGRKQDFLEFCQRLDVDRKMFFVAASTFNEYLPGLCAFKPGARKTDYYEKIISKWG